MKNPVLASVVLAVVSTSTFFVSCGKKDSDSGDAPKPAPQSEKPSDGSQNPSGTPTSTTSVDGIDGRIFGSWLLLERPLKIDATGEEIPGAVLRMTLSIAKDKLTATSEVVTDGKSTCKAEASTTKVSVTKDKIVIGEALSKSTSIDAKTTCRVSLDKSELGYVVESDDVLRLSSKGSDKTLPASRIK